MNDSYPYPQTFEAWLARDSKVIGGDPVAFDAWFGVYERRFSGDDAMRDARQWIADQLGERPSEGHYGIRLAGEAGFSAVDPIIESSDPDDFEPTFIGGLDGSPFPNDGDY